MRGKSRICSQGRCCSGRPFLVLKWKYVVHGSIESGNALWSRLGVPQAPESRGRIDERIIAQVLDALWILRRLGHPFTFFTATIGRYTTPIGATYGRFDGRKTTDHRKRGRKGRLGLTMRTA